MDIYQYSFTVGPESIDVLKHVNNREYLRWMEKAAMDHASSLGCGAKECLARNEVWVAREHWIEYLRPCYEGDELTVYSWVEKMMAPARFVATRLSAAIVSSVWEQPSGCTSISKRAR